MDSIGDDNRKPKGRNFQRSYTPSNIDFLSIPEQNQIEHGLDEPAYIVNLNRIFGMLDALSEQIQCHDPLLAYELVNSALGRFWLMHHSDHSFSKLSEDQCWLLARRYWA